MPGLCTDEAAAQLLDPVGLPREWPGHVLTAGGAFTQPDDGPLQLLKLMAAGVDRVLPAELLSGHVHRSPVVLVSVDEDRAELRVLRQRDLFRPSSVTRTGGGVLVTYPLFAPPGLLVPFSSR